MIKTQGILAGFCDFQNMPELLNMSFLPIIPKSYLMQIYSPRLLHCNISAD